MTVAETAALVALPIASAVWGVTWALPLVGETAGRAKNSRWSEPRFIVGVIALVVSMNLAIVDVLGSLAIRIAVFALIPFALGWVFGRAIRAHDGGPVDPAGDES